MLIIGPAASAIGDQGAHPDPQRGEAEHPDHDGQDEGQAVHREVVAEAERPHRQQDPHLQQGDDQGAEEDGAQQRPGGDRAEPEPLEQAHLAPVHQGLGQDGEAGGHDGVGDETGQVVLDQLDGAVARADLRVPGDGSEQDQEDDREAQGEEGAQRVEPEAQLLVPDLAPHQPDVAEAVEGARWWGWTTGWGGGRSGADVASCSLDRLLARLDRIPRQVQVDVFEGDPDHREPGERVVVLERPPGELVEEPQLVAGADLDQALRRASRRRPGDPTRRPRRAAGTGWSPRSSHGPRWTSACRRPRSRRC